MALNWCVSKSPLLSAFELCAVWTQKSKRFYQTTSQETTAPKVANLLALFLTPPSDTCAWMIWLPVTSSSATSSERPTKQRRALRTGRGASAACAGIAPRGQAVVVQATATELSRAARPRSKVSAGATQRKFPSSSLGGAQTRKVGSASSLNVNGYHQVVGISVAPAPPCTKACPLAVDIMHVPSVVRHNFTEEQSCPIPVTVRVANQLLDAQAEAVDIGFGIIQDSWEISSESAISWVGAVQCTIRSLKSATSVDIHLCACVSGPGVYDLNQFTVRLLLHGKCFSFPVHAAVSVESAH